MLALLAMLSTSMAVAGSRGAAVAAAARLRPPLMTTLYDMPVSNHGARVRLLIYKLGLEKSVQVCARAARALG